MGIQINGQTDTISAVDNSFSLAGNVSIGGTLTYEDVTSVDAVGLSTFQAGIQLDDSITHLGDTDTKIRFPANDTFTVETGGSERLRLTGAGNIGINSTAPTKKLDVQGHAVFGPSATRLHTYSDSGYSGIYNGSSLTSDESFYMGGGNLYFRADGGEVIRVLASGKVGINESSPLQQLHVSSTASTYIQVQNTGDSVNAYYGVDTASAWAGSSTNHPFKLHTNNTERLRIDANGSAQFKGGNAPSGRDTRISRYASLLVGYNTSQSGELVSNPRCSIDAGNGNIRTEGYIAGGIAGSVTPAGKLYVRAADECNFVVREESTSLVLSAETNNGRDNNRLLTLEGSGLVFNSGGSEKLRITSAGEIGIGNNGSFGIFTGANDRNLLLGTGSGNNGIQLHCSTTGYGGIYFGDSSSGNARYSGYVEYKNSENFFRIATSEAERLRINSAGQVGINDTGPTRTLSVNGNMNLASGSRIESYSSGGNLIIQGGSTYPGGHIHMYGGTGDDMMTFNTSGGSASSIERMRITSAGLVGVNDSTSGWAEAFQVTSSAAYNQYGIAVKIQGTSGYLIRFGNGTNNPCGSVSSSGGNSTSFNTYWSDSRRKKNFETWNEEVLPHFKSLEPKKFNFTNEDDGTVKTKGYVAQDNVDKFPEAYPYLDDSEVDEKRYMFNPSGMVIYLMKALQEEIAKREALEQRLTDAGL